MRLQFQLAARLGKTHGQLMSEIDSSELPYWYAMESIDPWSDRRQDAYLAQIAYALAATWSKSKLSFSEFFLEFDPEERDRKALLALKAWGKRS